MQEKVSPFAGTARLESLANAFGATPSCARPNSIRLLQYTQLLYTESAAVSTTMFSAFATKVSPNSWKISTNGLVSAVTRVHGISESRTANEPI